MIRRVLTGWDLLAAAATSLAVYMVSPPRFSDAVAKEIYGAGISVLSIIFAVYFTALAVIIAASDDDFVEYLREKGVYDTLMGIFKFTLWLLFASLLSSFILFAYSAVRSDTTSPSSQPHWIMEVFSFFFSYALFATMYTTRDALSYARYRVLFLSKQKQKTGQN